MVSNLVSLFQPLKIKSSLMSGYVFADSEALVIQKVGTNVEYKLTLAMVKLYNFTVLGFNSGYRTNEITM